MARIEVRMPSNSTERATPASGPQKRLIAVAMMTVGDELMSISSSAKNVMTRVLITLSPEMDVTDAIHELVRNDISGAPVVDTRGNLVGILTERDCLDAFVKASYHSELGGPVAEFMSRDVRSVDAEASVMEIAHLFVEFKYRRYPVLKGNQLIGLISRRDILRGLLDLS